MNIAEELARVPPNHWVAMAQDESEIIYVAPTLKEAIAGAKRRGATDPLMLKTPPEWDLMIP